ncbi:MAG: T9SS type A sorting domain-containing protein [Chitinophagaceae bacterium]
MDAKFLLVKIILLKLVILATTLGLHAQPPTHTRHFSPVLDANINGFYEYLPRNYTTDPLQKYPLLVFFHGVGESGSVPNNPTLDNVLIWGPPKLINAGFFPDSFSVGGQWHKFIVISPQIKSGLDGSTVTSTIQPATVDAVIEYAKAAYQVDLSRIYLCGLSMGGGATWDYAGSSAGAANKLAAIAVACGAGDLSTAEANTIAAAKLPVLATHNKGDGTVIYTRTDANAALLNAYAPALVPPPKIVKWEGGSHNVWSRTYEDINAGITSQGFTGNLTDSLGMNVYQWMLQFARTSGTLPMQWISFAGNITNGKTILHWTVSQEIDVQNYIVERSQDGFNWQQAGILASQKNNQQEQQYSFIDMAAEVFFYRIKQTDTDGRYSFSKIIKAGKLDYPKAQAIVFPNPFSKQISISLSGYTQKKVRLRIVNLTGATMLQKIYSLTDATQNILVNNSSMLSTGTYYLSIEDENGNIGSRHKIMKQ